MASRTDAASASVRKKFIYQLRESKSLLLWFNSSQIGFGKDKEVLGLSLVWITEALETNVCNERRTIS